MSRLKAEIRSYFATPVAIATLEDAASLNAELKRAILERERRDEGVQHSNLGGWQSDWDFEDWGGAAARRLLDGARELATRLTSDRAGRAARVAWKTNAWANVNRKGHGNEFHTHPGCFWSGTYYVDDGGSGADHALGGEFEMQDPRGVAPAMYAPLLGFAVPGGQSAGASELIHPQSGQIVLFPSWMSHAVRPYHGDRERISVAFNFSV
ncbi:MAG: TIGR02466 family protein [Geminicoccaceae bacterium]